MILCCFKSYYKSIFSLLLFVSKFSSAEDEEALALRVFILFSDVFELTTELAGVLATELVVKVALVLSLDGTLVEAAILLVAAAAAVMTEPVLTSRAWLGAGDELRFVTVA